MRNRGARARAHWDETIAHLHAIRDVTVQEEPEECRVDRCHVMASDRSLPPTQGRIPRRSIFCHPERPHPVQVLEYLRRYAGWEFASSPETADWCILFQDATWVTLP